MSALDIIKNGLKYVGPVVHALQVIQSITGTGGQDATTALRAIDTVVKTTLDGITKGIDPAEIIKENDKVNPGYKGNDARADTALRDKYKGKP